jgi:putative hydrolase
MSDQSPPNGLPDFGNEDELREAFQRFLSGDQGFDPAEFMKAAGIDVNSVEIKTLMAQLGGAFGATGTPSPLAARDHAVSVAQQNSSPLDPATAAAITTAANVANLWLGEVVDIAELGEPPMLATRADWARKTLPVWEAISEPVALAIPRAVGQMLQGHAPEGLEGMLGDANGAMEKVGRALFQLQLAQVVGKLSEEVLSGGDIGIPLVHGGSEYDVQAVLVAQNMRAFGQGLDTPVEEADIFLSVREIAHARLFRHARWLRLGIMSTIRDFASGITIDTDRIVELAENFDPTDTNAMRDLVASGALLPERTEEQTRALERLETLLALIEGWVDHVTSQATSRLPKSSALQEAIRRRRASGGPAEHAFSTLVGLELRPRRLREASALWSGITEALGSSARDSLWEHPDQLPTSEDLDDPQGFTQRHLAPSGPGDDMDQALRDLLDEEQPPS